MLQNSTEETEEMDGLSLYRQTVTLALSKFPARDRKTWLVEEALEVLDADDETELIVELGDMLAIMIDITNGMGLDFFEVVPIINFDKLNRSYNERHLVMSTAKRLIAESRNNSSKETENGE